MDMDIVERANKPLNIRGSLVCGAFAGLVVDLSLFPIDTVKTRLQSGLGFVKAGGFKSIYNGMPSVLVGSAPGSALFFLTYEGVKTSFQGSKIPTPIVHMSAAAIGEIVACFARVPTEVVKQRAQAKLTTSTKQVLIHILKYEGLEGLYRGYFSTVAREIPFSLIEFPLWEMYKRLWSKYQDRPVLPWQGAACGSLAGAVAAAMTTPLDVAKTRIMLSHKLHGDGDVLTVRRVLGDIWSTDGLRGIYAGVVPRTVWMAFGGFLFFGAYELAKDLFTYGDAVQAILPDRMYIWNRIHDWWYMDEYLKNHRIKTFDDVVAEAIEVQERRDAVMAARKAAKMDSSGQNKINGE